MRQVTDGARHDPHVRFGERRRAAALPHADTESAQSGKGCQGRGAVHASLNVGAFTREPAGSTGLNLAALAPSRVDERTRRFGTARSACAMRGGASTRRGVAEEIA